jgi:hypothetical protein
MTETDSIDRVVVAGSRSIEDRDLVRDVIESVDDEWDPTTYLHGGADGVDTLVDRIVNNNPFSPSKSVETHPIPEWVWEKVGRKAGPMRNEYMVENADALVALWDGESSGTKNAVKLAEGNNLLVRRIVCNGCGDDWSIGTDQTYDERDQAQLGDF